MTADQTYNGWTNYATWGVALVLDNDQGTYNEVRERAAAIVEQTRDGSDVSTPAQLARYELADWLKDYTEELCGLERDDDSLRRVSPTLMAHQVIAAGLAEVDWLEIARNILSELEA